MARPTPVGPDAAKEPSDRGSQFRSRRFVHALSSARLTGSMGRVGAAGDNAAMESFFALLQKNVLDQLRWATRQQRRLAIVTWIEGTLSPATSATRPGPFDAERIRDHHDHNDRKRGLNK